MAKMKDALEKGEVITAVKKKGICYNTDQLCDDERCYCDSKEEKSPLQELKEAVAMNPWSLLGKN